MVVTSRAVNGLTAWNRGAGVIASDRHGIVAAFGQKAVVSATSRLTAFASLSERDYELLAQLASGRRSVGKGEVICHEGDKLDGLFLLIQGWVASSITFADGSEQLLDVHLPGDFLGTPDLAVSSRLQSIVALTPVELVVVPQQMVGLLFERSPRLAAILFLVSQEERVRLMDRLASVGATDAVPRLASLLLHIHSRLTQSEPSTGDSFTLPLSQMQVASLVGLSQAHLNRTLQTLRRSAALTWTRQSVTILDRSALQEMSGLPQRSLDRNANWLPSRDAK